MKPNVPRNLLLCVSSALLATSSLAFESQDQTSAQQGASEDNFIQTVIAPSCLLKESTIAFKELGKKENFVLIQAGTQDLGLLREQTHHKACGGFLDVSPEWQNVFSTQKTTLSTKDVKYFADKILTQELSTLKNQEQTFIADSDFTISHQTQVDELLNLFESQRLWDDLTVLTRFPDRYAVSENGVKVANWFKDQVESIANANNRTDVAVRFVPTGGSFKQPSVVVTIAGTEPNEPGVLVGGHMDTLSNNKPGADDDGSGSVTVLETLRVVLNSNMRFKRTLHFVWYSAEEQGLIGSQVVVNDFVAKKIPLRGVLHFDMTGYEAQKTNKIYMIDDNVNPELSKFVAELATNYAKVEVAHTACGYACSDHASWTRKKFPSAMPFEAKFSEDNPHIHTSNDTIDKLSLEHMSKFARIGIAFVGELAEPAESNI